MSRIVTVTLGARSYDIYIENGLLARAGAVLKPLLKKPRVIPITDHTVAALYLDPLLASLRAEGIEVLEPITVAAGEQTKTLAAFEDLIEAMLERAMERSVTVLAIGGGVVGDLAGFAAATVLRGVDFVQVPTTLLAQVDSSVGGKTGVNSRHGKNLIGAFHQPRAVLIDPLVLQSLPRREVLAGYAEVLKYGLIENEAFFVWCESEAERLIAGEAEAREHAIAESCAAKARLVSADEFEGGARALLNFGHTFGHALEADAGLGKGHLLHGEAIGVGMVLACRLSARLGYCDEALAGRVARHLANLGLPARIADTPSRTTAPEALIAFMRHDKKVQDGKLTFILTRGIGQAFVAHGVNEANVISILKETGDE